MAEGAVRIARFMLENKMNRSGVKTGAVLVIKGTPFKLF